MELNDILAARRATDEALEAYAREVFDLNNVAYKIFRATQMGRSSARMVQERPVDLSKTESATLVILHLVSLGYDTYWLEVKKDSVLPKHDGGHEIVYCELMIEWHVRAFAGTE